MQIAAPKPYAVPTKSDGTVIAPLQSDGRQTLLANTTYYYALPGNTELIGAVHLQGDSAIILTSADIEESCFDPGDVSLVSTSAADWMKQDPSSAYIPVVGAGWSVTNATVAAAGGAAGGAIWDLGNLGGKRRRLKVVVGGTGGKLRVGTNGKA